MYSAAADSAILRPVVGRIVRSGALFVACAVVVSACASSSTSETQAQSSTSTEPAPSTTVGATTSSAASGESDGASPDGSDFLDTEPNPLPVSLGAVGQTVTVEVGPDGGVIETSSNGTTFTLDVPAGAVLDPTPISMTPIDVSTDAADLDLSGVRMEPDGLILLKRATLVVDGSFDEALAQVGFGTDHAGAGFYLAPTDGGSDMAFGVSHFSIIGVAEASQAEIDRVLESYVAVQREQRAFRELMLLFGRVPAGDDRNAAMTATFNSWFRSIERDADRASDSDTVESLFSEYISAVHTVETMERLVSETTGEPVVFDGVADAQFRAAGAIQDAMHRMFREANLRCIQDRDPDQVFDMLKWAAFHEYLFQEGLGPEHRADEFEQGINQCMRFELIFKSSISTDVDGVTFDADVSSVIDLTFSDGANTNFLISQRTFKSPEIEAVLTGEAVANSDLVCDTSAKIAGALDLSLRYPTGGAVSDAEIDRQSVLIRFPEPVIWDCGVVSMGHAPWFPWFHTFWEDWYLGEGLYDFPLRAGSGGTYASLTESGLITEGGGPVAITFTVELRHDPQLP